MQCTKHSQMEIPQSNKNGRAGTVDPAMREAFRLGYVLKANSKVFSK